MTPNISLWYVYLEVLHTCQEYSIHLHKKSGLYFININITKYLHHYVRVPFASMSCCFSPSISANVRLIAKYLSFISFSWTSELPFYSWFSNIALTGLIRSQVFLFILWTILIVLWMLNNQKDRRKQFHLIIQCS